MFINILFLGMLLFYVILLLKCKILIGIVVEWLSIIYNNYIISMKLVCEFCFLIEFKDIKNFKWKLFGCEIK